MLDAVVIHPDRKEVFPLCPEPISKLDGSTKNDFQKEHSRLEVIFTEDALSAKGPYLQKILAIGTHFIVGAKRPGNPGLFAWLKGASLKRKTITTDKEVVELSFYNGVPLNDKHHDLEVNFINFMITDKKRKKKHFSWVTDITVTTENVYQLAKGGRASRKIENETFNTLKNQGYQFEHNFGHGCKHLSHVLGLLMFLAFLLDQVQQRCCGLFQNALKKMKRKIVLWSRLRSVFLIFYVDSRVDLFTCIAHKKGAKLKDLFDTS